MRGHAPSLLHCLNFHHGCVSIGLPIDFLEMAGPVAHKIPGVMYRQARMLQSFHSNVEFFDAKQLIIMSIYKKICLRSPVVIRHQSTWLIE